MERIIKYDCFQTLRQLPDTGDLKKYEKQALIILQYSKQTFIDSKVFADTVLYIRDNWKDWDSYRGLLLRYRIYKKYKKSFKKFNRIMAKDLAMFDTAYPGKAYHYTKRTVERAKRDISNGDTDALANTSKELDGLLERDMLSSVEYIELKRDLYNTV